MIDIRLFGGLVIDSNDGPPVAALGRKSECLIGLLALSDGMQVTRQQAAGLIWSDRGEEQARASLRQELSLLRRAIGDDVITTTKQTIGLVSENVSVDVLEFRSLAAVDTTQSLEAAATLYTGALLAGRDSKSEAFEDWIEADRRILEYEALGVMIRLAQHQMEAGLAEEAGKWAEQAIRIDPLRETSHRLAIEALAMAGERAAALAKYAQLEELLKTELGVGPSQPTIELGERLRSGEFAATAAEPRTSSVPASVLNNLFSGRAAVAVLPFRCMSSADDDVFFTDGITDDVVNGLAAWRWFPVVGRYTTNHYRGEADASGAVSNQTGARYIIDGSVRRSGSQIRVTAELCDAASGQQLWSRRFDRKADDVFEIQDEISDEIARRVEPEIRRAESKRLYRQKPSQLSVWELLHKARVTKFRSGHAYGTKEDNVTAMAMFRDVTERDPSSSDGVSGIATCHWHDAINSWSSDPAKSGEAAIRRANQAVDLDSTNYSALATVSIIQIFGQHDIATGEVTARKSLEMNPSDILTRHYLVCSLEFGGKFDEAVEQCKYMMALDPLAPSISVLYGDLSTCLLLGGHPVEAVEYSRKSMVADPNYSRGRQRFIAALVAAGEMSEAKQEYSKLMKAMPAFNLDYVKRTYPFADEKNLLAYSKYFAEVGVQ